LWRSPPQRRRSKEDGGKLSPVAWRIDNKIHALVDALGNPANLMLTAGRIHDLACAGA
jgi:hypothetical protein